MTCELKKCEIFGNEATWPVVPDGQGGEHELKPLPTLCFPDDKSKPTTADQEEACKQLLEKFKTKTRTSGDPCHGPSGDKTCVCDIIERKQTDWKEEKLEVVVNGKTYHHKYYARSFVESGVCRDKS